MGWHSTFCPLMLVKQVGSQLGRHKIAQQKVRETFMLLQTIGAESSFTVKQLGKPMWVRLMLQGVSRKVLYIYFLHSVARLHDEELVCVQRQFWCRSLRMHLRWFGERCKVSRCKKKEVYWCEKRFFWWNLESAKKECMLCIRQKCLKIVALTVRRIMRDDFRLSFMHATECFCGHLMQVGSETSKLCQELRSDSHTSSSHMWEVRD